MFKLFTQFLFCIILYFSTTYYFYFTCTIADITSIENLTSSGVFNLSKNSVNTKFSSLQINGKIINQRFTIPFTFLNLYNENVTLYLSLSTKDEGVYVFDSESNFCKSKFNNFSNSFINYDNVCFDKHSIGSKWCLTNHTCSINNLCIKCISSDFNQLPWDYASFGSDGNILTDKRILGYTDFTISLNIDNYLFEKHPISLISYFNSYNKWPSMTDLDGVWGISGPQICVRGQSLWHSILNLVTNPIFGFDVNLPLPQREEKTQDNFSKANILIGNDTFIYYPLTWSERRQTGENYIDASYRFTIYNLEICNVNLLGNYSSNWEVEIDTSSECLVLPDFIFDNLISWAPIDKESCTQNSSNKMPNLNKPVICPVLYKNLDELPTLTFTLSEMSSKQFEIPLMDLIYYDYDLKKEFLCIARSNSNYQLGPMVTRGTIGFGLSVLNILYPVVDSKNAKVGLFQKSNNTSSGSGCVSPAICIGQQTFSKSSNSCIDPICSIYYFMKLNNVTKECEISSYVFPLVISIIVILALSEFSVFLIYSHLIKVAASRSK